MAILRRDDWLQTPQGQALPGAQVYYLTQPADTTEFPPSPLATVYSDATGTPGTNPVLTDGFGHAVAYLNDGQLYTLAFYHPLLGAAPLVLADQSLNGASSGAITPFNGGLVGTSGGIITGAVNGENTVFTLPFTPLLLFWNLNGQVLQLNVGYTAAVVSGVFTITMAVAPKTGASLNASGIV
jgi:hypothetical protein